MSRTVKDLKFALRQLFKTPGFTAVVVLTLALGIGANTAVFSIVNGLLLRPLAYRDSDRLAIIWTHSPGANVAQDWPSPPQFLAVEASSSVFEALALSQGFGVTLTGQGSPERLGAVSLSASAFSLLGAKVEAGRVFLPEEFSPGKPVSVILSHGFWQRRFGGNPDVSGRQLTLFGNTYPIVGIMPADFQLGNEVLPTVGAIGRVDLFLPLQLDPDRMSNHLDENYTLLARLKKGATFEQAQAELNYAAHRLEQEAPAQYPASRRFSFSIRPLLEQVVGDWRPSLYAVAGAVACVLLIASANVANLLLARATTREKEIAIRASSLGAGRWPIVRQLLTESLLLAVLGGALGVLLAVGGLEAMRWLDPGNIPRRQDIVIDGRVLAFTSTVVLLTGILFGLAPAVRCSRLSLAASLKEAGRSVAGGRHRLRNLLVVIEIALATVLVVSAGLLIRSLAQVRQVEPGFTTENVLSLRLAVLGPAYAEESRQVSYFQRLLEGVRLLPGVESAGCVSILPLAGGIGWTIITIEGYDPAAGQSAIQADRRIATTGYFETMKIPLIDGRLFGEQDTQESPPVVLIDERLARTYWPNANPLGRRLKLGDAGNTNAWMTIIGVVASVKQYALDSDSRVAFYVPHGQAPSGTMYLTVRTLSNPASLVAAVSREALALEPNVPIYDVKTMEQWRWESLARRRFAVQALGMFAGVAMLLASFGIYGVMSYAVAQRTREIGVRMALGAERRDVLLHFIGSGAKLALTGAALGLMGCLAVTRFVSSLLFGVTPGDPWTLAGASSLLMVIAILASWAPACRATRINPMEALRSE
jgi:predicted permease